MAEPIPFEPKDSASCFVGSAEMRVQPAGDAQSDALRLDFDPDPDLKLEFDGSSVTSDAGLLACRELGDAPGLSTPDPGGQRKLLQRTPDASVPGHSAPRRSLHRCSAFSSCAGASAAAMRRLSDSHISKNGVFRESSG